MATDAGNSAPVVTNVVSMSFEITRRLQMIKRSLLLQSAFLCLSLCAASPAAADYFNGLAANIKGDYVTACKEFKEAAERNHIKAQINLGAMYRNGRCLPKSDEEAVKWFRMAAEQKDAEGQFQLALMYMDGRGVAKSEEEGIKLLQLAAAQNLVEAQAGLGNIYLKGIGVKKNPEEAYKWFHKGALLENQFCMRMLGDMYLKGQGVKKDHVQAYMWATLALEYKDAPAGDLKFQLKKVMKPEEIAEAEKLARKWKTEKKEKKMK